MKRYLLAALLLSGCSSLPSTPEIPLQSVQRGDPTGSPAAPIVRSFTACIIGDSLYLTAVLHPTSQPLPSYAEWGFQAWVGTRYLDQGQSTSAEYVITARELQDIGPLARVVRRTESNSFPCSGPGGWCDSVGTARLITLNGRKLEMVVPLRSLSSPTGTVAAWLLFGADDRFVSFSFSHCLATRKGLAFTERF